MYTPTLLNVFIQFFFFYGRGVIALTSVVSHSKVSACSVGELGLIPGSGRSPGEGNDNPFQYSCLQNPMDRAAR